MRNGNGSSSSNGVSSIPATTKKMVQHLKEIVNCPEHEIYAMLKDCNMDPNDTINRLLSQDPFHEVKSKRKKKKEMNENTESRSRGISGTSNRGRGGADHDVGRRSFTKFSSSDSRAARGKPAYKKDNGIKSIPNSSSASGMTANNVNCRSTSLSDPVSMENTVQIICKSDSISLSSKPSSGFQPAWAGAPGHVSMADIVKMGRPHAKISTATFHSPHNAVMSNMSQQSAKHHLLPTSSESHHDIHLAHDPASKVSDITNATSMAVNQDVSCRGWPLIEQSPATSGPSVCEPSGVSVIYADPSSSLVVDRVNLHATSEVDEVRETQGIVAVQNQMEDSAGSAAAAASDRQIQVDNSAGPTCFDDSSFTNRTSHQSQSPGFEHQEGIGGTHLPISDCGDTASVENASEAESSAAAGLQHLSLENEEIGAPPAGENPAVIIPNHLRVLTADCSHLSFGSFGSGINATFTGSFASKTRNSYLSEASAEEDGSSVEHFDSRNPEYYNNEQQRSTSNENVVSPSSSQPEVLKHDTAVEATNGHQYPFPSSVPGYAIENTTQTNVAGYSSQMNSQIQNLASFSSVMVNKPSDFTTLQPTPQALPSTSIPTGPALPQHLAMHPYSQPTLFANMITYPFLPQSYTYMPSAFQQAYAANNVYHQTPATVQSAGIKYSLPQYKNSISASSLPLPATVASGYGGFESSPNIPGSCLLNPSTTPPSTTIGYDEVIGSQYKDSNHYCSPQQDEASTMWVNGLPVSRTMSALPASTYYGFQGQNQHGVIRQTQQPSHYGALGYPNYYHSQARFSQ